MIDILNLLDELLEHDSGSKIFFPLARLYRKQGELEKAIAIVRKGLANHPDYLEAQLFLVELLSEYNASDDAEAIAQDVFTKLLAYDKFWLTLKNYYLKNHQPDLALAAFLAERNVHSEKIDLFAVLASGISHSDAQQATAVLEEGEPEFDLDADEVTRFCLNSGIKTKTMAKLFCAQGEYAQAVEIYDELIKGALGDQELTELQALRDAANKNLAPDENTGADKGKKLFNVLNSLATRLEGKSA